MSIYSTVENVLLRDYEVLRGLSEATIDKIVVDDPSQYLDYGITLHDHLENFLKTVRGNIL